MIVEEQHSAFSSWWGGSDKQAMYRRDFITKSAAQDIFDAGWDAAQKQSGVGTPPKHVEVKPPQATFNLP